MPTASGSIGIIIARGSRSHVPWVRRNRRRQAVVPPCQMICGLHTAWFKLNIMLRLNSDKRVAPIFDFWVKS